MTTGAKDRFKRAEQAAKKGNFEYAVELYLQGLTLDPKAGEERRRLHQIETLSIQEQGGNPEGGMSAKVKTVGVQAKARKLAMQKKWDEAVLELEKAVRLQPRNPGLLLQLAQYLENMEAEEGCLNVLEEIVDADHQNIEALRRLGHLWAKRDDPEKAIEYWEKLRMIKPEDKEASKAVRDLSAASMVRRTEERKAETGDESFQALLKDEEESADLEKKAKVLRSEEDRRQAVQFKIEELKKEPKNSRLWRELGALYQELRDWKHAMAAFKKAKEVNPHDLFADDKMGALRETVWDERLEQLRAKIAEAKTNGGNGSQLEELNRELEKAEKEVLDFKLKEYDRRVKAHPTDYDLKMRYGKLLMDAKQYNHAIEQFQKSIKDPKFKVQSQNHMGLCFQAMSVHKLAIDQYQAALGAIADADSDVAKDIRYNLAVAYQECGDADSALDHFQKIMAVDISYRDVSHRVGELIKGSS